MSLSRTVNPEPSQVSVGSCILSLPLALVPLRESHIRATSGRGLNRTSVDCHWMLHAGSKPDSHATSSLERALNDARAMHPFDEQDG